MTRTNHKTAPSKVLDVRTVLVDNTGGTPTDTLAVIADSATADAVSSIAVKLNAVIGDLKAKGLMDS